MKKKLDKTIWNIYRELYKNSTPSADFDKLVEEAPINEDGEREIDFMSYEIDQSVYDNIVEKHINGLGNWDKLAVKVNVDLGCSPKFKK